MANEIDHFIMEDGTVVGIKDPVLRSSMVLLNSTSVTVTKEEGINTFEVALPEQKYRRYLVRFVTVTNELENSLRTEWYLNGLGLTYYAINTVNYSGSIGFVINLDADQGTCYISKGYNTLHSGGLTISGSDIVGRYGGVEGLHNRHGTEYCFRAAFYNGTFSGKIDCQVFGITPLV